MSASQGVNVLRYSALAFGVFYGFSHQRSINSAQKAAHDQHEYQHKQQLIEKARAEYARSKQPLALRQRVADPMDPKFDLEAFFNSLMEQKA